MIWIIYSLLSAFFFGVRDILVKKVDNDKVNSLDLIFVEYLVLILFLFIIFPNKINFALFSSMWDLYLIKAISILASTGIYFYLLKKYDISKVSPLLNLSPIFLIIMTNFFLFEYLTWYQYLGIFLILVSTYYLEIILYHVNHEKPHIHHFNVLKSLKTNFFILVIIVLITISLRAILDKVTLVKADVITDLFFTGVFIFIILLFYYAFSKREFSIAEKVIYNPIIFVIAFFGIFSNYFILLATAIPIALVSLIIPIRRISTLFSSLMGGILFHEEKLFSKSITIICMLIGFFLIVI